MTQKSPKLAAARISLGTATALALLKLFTGLLTGSLAVLSSAVDSLLDILMSGINFMAIHKAEQPADECHPYGHGKFETLATIVQSLIIAGSGLWICVEAVRRLQHGSELERPLWGIAVMIVSLTASWLITRYLRKVAKLTDSSALEADALHFATDVYSNLALLIGLAILYFFDIPWLDPVISLLVAGYIIVQAIGLLRQGLRDMLDEQLPETLRSEIEHLIEDHKGELFGYHNLRTRRAGSQKLIDFHLTVCKHLTVDEAHGITDRLEEQIAKQINGADVTIHIEPCQEACCPGRKECPAQKIRKRDS